MFDNMQVGNYVFDSQLAMEWGEKIIMALAILVITWVIAKIAVWAFSRLAKSISFMSHTNKNGVTIGDSLGKIVSLIIWLFGLIAILQVFALNNVIRPVETMLDEVMGFIPNLIGAGVLFFIGIMIARIVKQLIETAMSTVNFDAWIGRASDGLSSVREDSGAEAGEPVLSGPAIGRTLGIIAYVLIIVPFAIAALQQLGISAISDPATGMLNEFMLAIPRIIGAAVVLVIGFFIASWAGQVLRQIVAGFGVDNAFGSLDFLPAGTTASSIVGRIAQIAIMLGAAITAARMLEFPELTLILNDILELGGRVIFGSVIIAVGFWLARLISSVMQSTTGETNLGATIVKYATIVLFVAMGLSYMDFGDGEIVNMAFGALAVMLGVGGAIAVGIAFGMGGRDYAARKLEKMDRIAGDTVATATTPSAKKAAAKNPTAKKPAPKK